MAFTEDGGDDWEESFISSYMPMVRPSPRVRPFPSMDEDEMYNGALDMLEGQDRAVDVDDDFAPEPDYAGDGARNAQLTRLGRFGAPRQPRLIRRLADGSLLVEDGLGLPPGHLEGSADGRDHVDPKVAGRYREMKFNAITYGRSGGPRPDTALDPPEDLRLRSANVEFEHDVAGTNLGRHAAFESAYRFDASDPLRPIDVPSSPQEPSPELSWIKGRDRFAVVRAAVPAGAAADSANGVAVTGAASVPARVGGRAPWTANERRPLGLGRDRHPVRPRFVDLDAGGRSGSFGRDRATSLREGVRTAVNRLMDVFIPGAVRPAAPLPSDAPSSLQFAPSPPQSRIPSSFGESGRPAMPPSPSHGRHDGRGSTRTHRIAGSNIPPQDVAGAEIGRASIPRRSDRGGDRQSPPPRGGMDGAWSRRAPHPGSGHRTGGAPIRMPPVRTDGAMPLGSRPLRASAAMTGLDHRGGAAVESRPPPTLPRPNLVDEGLTVRYPTLGTSEIIRSTATGGDFPIGPPAIGSIPGAGVDPRAWLIMNDGASAQAGERRELPYSTDAEFIGVGSFESPPRELSLSEQARVLGPSAAADAVSVVDLSRAHLAGVGRTERGGERAGGYLERPRMSSSAIGATELRSRPGELDLRPSSLSETIISRPIASELVIGENQRQMGYAFMDRRDDGDGDDDDAA